MVVWSDLDHTLAETLGKAARDSLQAAPLDNQERLSSWTPQTGLELKYSCLKGNSKPHPFAPNALQIFTQNCFACFWHEAKGETSCLLAQKQFCFVTTNAFVVFPEITSFQPIMIRTFLWSDTDCTSRAMAERISVCASSKLCNTTSWLPKRSQQIPKRLEQMP